MANIIFQTLPYLISSLAKAKPTKFASKTLIKELPRPKEFPILINETMKLLPA